MYCRYCGEEIDSSARFCPRCGADQSVYGGSSAEGAYGPSPGPGPSGTVYHDPAEVQAQRRSAMMTTLVVTLVASFVLGALFGVVVLVLMVLYHAVMRKSDNEVTMGCVLGGIGGIVVGYILNIILFTMLVASLYSW